MGPILHDIFSKIPYHGTFIEWIVFQTNFNAFEMV